MRSPTTLLFSLVIGAVILVATTDKMRELMGLPGPDEPTMSESVSNTLQDTRQEVQELLSSIRTGIGRESAPPEPVVQPRSIWTWTDDQGVRHFSDEPPPEGTSSQRMVIEPVPVADNRQVPPPPPERPPVSPEQAPDEIPPDHPANLIRGLRNFQKYQRDLREAEHGQ